MDWPKLQTLELSFALEFGHVGYAEAELDRGRRSFEPCSPGAGQSCNQAEEALVISSHPFSP
jgi:hypothetical protein